jgi:hypothetical protein
MSLILIRGSALTTTLLIHVKTTLERGGLSKTLLQSTNASKPCSGMVPTLKWALILIPFPWCSEHSVLGRIKGRMSERRVYAASS